MTLRPRGPARRPQPVRPTMRRSIPGAPARRTRSVRRASAGLSPVRAGAILAMLVSSAAVYGVAQATSFQYADVVIEGATFTDQAAIVAAVEDAKGANLFSLVTRPLEEKVRQIPTVRGADVSVRLPTTLVVRVRERPVHDAHAHVVHPACYRSHPALQRGARRTAGVRRHYL